MSTKPILFSTPMVQAILDGRKTMTRRVMKPQPVITANGKPLDGYNDSMIKAAGDFPISQYQPGDILWVREKWRSVDFEYCDCVWSASIQYADGKIGTRVFWYDNSDVGIPDNCIYNKTGWRPSIHMPKEVARIFLRVTDVRLELLQDITSEDICNEGIWIGHTGIVKGVDFSHKQIAMLRRVWERLWNVIYAKRGCSWDVNPWVWVYTFDRCDKPEGWCK